MVLAHVSQENIEHKVGSNLMAKKKVSTAQIRERSGSVVECLT